MSVMMEFFAVLGVLCMLTGMILITTETISRVRKFQSRPRYVRIHPDDLAQLRKQ